MESHSATYSTTVRNTSPLRHAASISYSHDQDVPTRSSNEYHSNYHHDFATSTPSSTAQNENDYTRHARTHQRSLTELLPQFPTFKSPNSRSPSRSPIKEISRKEYEDEFMATLTGDKDNIIKVADRYRNGLSSWFNGTSSPVQVGLSTEHSSKSSTPEKLFKRPASIQLDTNMRGGSSPRTPDLTSTLMNFSNKFFSPNAKKNSHHLNDELLNLDINKALFPTGRNENDPFSPSAFHNLLQNAEGLLQKMQLALLTRTQALSDLTLEKSAKDDEFEEAEIRAKSLKSQLEEMAAQIAEEVKLNTELAEALAAEKNARREEARAREKSIALVRAESAERDYSRGEHEENLGFPARPSSATPKKANRISSCSSSITSEDDEDVFSLTTSPRLSVSTCTTFSSINSSEILEATPARIVPHPSRRPSTTPQRSTFQKILHGDNSGKETSKLGMAEGRCSNCEGKDVGFAWDTVGMLREENRGLKEQAQRYQEGIDGALNAVLGIGMYAK